MTEQQFEYLIKYFNEVRESLRYPNCENSRDEKRIKEHYREKLEKKIEFVG